jgi:excisionase family DNA binding protein
MNNTSYDTNVNVLALVHQALNELKTSLFHQKPVLSLEEATHFTGISKSYLYKLTCSGGIPCYKPTGKRLYFKRDELEQWMLSNRKMTADEIEAAAVHHVTFGKGGAR